MPEPLPQPYPPNVQVELARERNRIAADRTLLSFIRNGLTLIGAGFGLEQVLKALLPTGSNRAIGVHLLSLTAIALGTFILLGAAQDYRSELKRLQQPEYTFTPRWSLATVEGVVVILAGLVLFSWMAIKAFR